MSALNDQVAAIFGSGVGEPAPKHALYSDVPQRLKNISHWVVWKYVTRGKKTKPPFDAKTGRNASTTDPSTWTTFANAVEVASHSKNGWDGVGFVFTDTPLVGVDFDGVCRDGKVEPYVAAILALLDSYTEISPSGNGLKTIIECPNPGLSKALGYRFNLGGHEGIEVYDKNSPRYFTITSDRFSGIEISKIEDFSLPYLLMRQYQNEKFKRLWIADATLWDKTVKSKDDLLAGHYKSQSEADLGLCALLAPLLSYEYARIEAAFLASALGCRDKITGRKDDYLRTTVLKAIGNHKPAGNLAAREDKSITQAAPFTREMKSGTADQITPKKIGWLWKNRFALKLNLIVGNPDQGKGLITYYLAACITTGRDWIDGQENHTLPRDEVLIMSAEEDWSDTIVPRLIAAEANLKNVHWLKMNVTSGMKVTERELQLDQDAAVLEEFLENHPHVSLVIIDPLSSYLGRSKMIDEQTIRSEILTPLKEMAGRRNVAVVGVMHLNKKVDLDSIHRVGGAVAFVGVARMVWLVAPKPVLDPAEDRDERVMVKVKGNIVHRKLQGLAFVTQARWLKLSDGDEHVPFVNWIGHVDAQADQLAGKPVRPAHRPAEQLPAAANWLRRYLKSGAKLEAQIERDSEFSKSTLKRARAEIGVRAFQKNRQWHWELIIPEGDGNEF